MNRADLQQLAEDRMLDAEALLNAGRWAGAYYLAGYAVECALKACIAKQTGLHDFPDKKFAHDVYTHDLTQLLSLAGLKLRLDSDSKLAAYPNLAANWQLAKDWNEIVRYQQRTENQARGLYQAVTNAADGVLPWIKGHW